MTDMKAKVVSIADYMVENEDAMFAISQLLEILGFVFERHTVKTEKGYQTFRFITTEGARPFRNLDEANDVMGNKPIGARGEGYEDAVNHLICLLMQQKKGE